MRAELDADGASADRLANKDGDWPNGPRGESGSGLDAARHALQ
jgi:hypothetical protein